MTGRMRRAVDWLLYRSEEIPADGSGPAAGVVPPARKPGSQVVTPRDALALGQVYRGVQIITTAASQLTLDAHRRGVRQPTTPPLLVKPEAGRRKVSGTIEFLVACLALRGNAFIRKFFLNPYDPKSSVTHVECLDPARVFIRDERFLGRPVVRTYEYLDDSGAWIVLQDHEVEHLMLLEVPGADYGLGPIQAAQADLSGALATRDAGAQWFDTSGVPSGTATTEQPVSPEKLAEYADAWNKVPAGRTRFLAAGLKYAPIGLSAKDAQFIESRQFDTTALARLLGVPASLMLAAVEGNAQTYANVEQEWIGFTRFTLMDYLLPIEVAFTSILPDGLAARFNVGDLLRSDAKTRYEAWAIAISAGIVTPAYVAAQEGIPPEAVPAAPPQLHARPTPEADQ